MAELMGIAGADPGTIERVLCRMRAHVGDTGGSEVAEWTDDALGFLQFHHGAATAGRFCADEEANGRLAVVDGVCTVRGADAEPRRHVLNCRPGRLSTALCRLSGSFNVLVYQPSEGRLLLAADRLATRPLYYALRETGLMFSTRFNALLAAADGIGGPLDFQALAQFMGFGHCLGETTFARGIRALPPGGLLEFGPSGVTVRRYWRPNYHCEQRTGTLQDWAQELADALRRAADRVAAPARTLGLLLSGGLDSRAALAAFEGCATAYTVADWSCREVRIARRAAGLRGWRHVFIRRPPDHYFQTLDLAIELSGGMERFDHCHFAGLADPIAAGCDVVVHEDAMDPLFKGYYWQGRWPVKGLRLPQPGTPRLCTDGLEDWITRHSLKSMHFSRPWMVLREPWRSRYGPALRSSVQRLADDADTGDPYHVAEHVLGLAGYGRTAFSASNVRGSVEFTGLGYDSDLVQLALRMPVPYRMDGRAAREALKRLDGRLYALPCAHTALRPDAPALAAWAARMADAGRVLLLRRLGRMQPTWREEGWPDRSQQLRRPRFRALLDDLTNDKRAFPDELFDRTRIRYLVREHVSGRRFHFPFLHCLITFGKWFRRFGPCDVA